MKTKLALIAAVIAASTAFSLQQANAQNVFPDSGFVGIGTTAPGALLHVKSSGGFEVSRVEGTTNIHTRFYEGNIYRGYVGSVVGAAEDMDLGTGGSNATGKLHLSIKASPKFTLDINGNAGIGTTTPAAKLHVYHNSTVSNPQLLLQEVGNDYARINFKNSNTTNYFAIAGLPASTTAASKLNFYYSGYGNVMTVQGNGNVGIGTVSPTYRLSVNGTIQAKEVRVETGWADYVFNKNYKLRSLDELEQYINTHKHLPGVAPAAEVEKEGMKVGEMNKAMMEKIEELTLYIIQLSKENKQLKSEIDALKK